MLSAIAFRIDAYWFATWAIAIPNILLIGTLVFLVTTLTCSLLASYVVLILILVLQATVSALVDPEDIALLSLLNPFGQVAISEITRYWTPFEMNEQVMPMAGSLLYNHPVSVGIDPFNKMIDRNPDDNVTRVSEAEE